jgi:hypothetical protein
MCEDDRANVGNLKIEDFRKALEDQDAIFQEGKLLAHPCGALG